MTRIIEMSRMFERAVDDIESCFASHVDRALVFWEPAVHF